MIEILIPRIFGHLAYNCMLLHVNHLLGGLASNVKHYFLGKK